MWGTNLVQCRLSVPHVRPQLANVGDCGSSNLVTPCLRDSPTYTTITIRGWLGRYLKSQGHVIHITNTRDFNQDGSA